MGESITQLEERQTISAVIITKNEEAMIANCLSTLRFADECIVVDSGSTDKTVEIAKREGAHVIHMNSGSFKDWRNAGLQAATKDWVLYVDADERVTPKLADEIRRTIDLTPNAALSLRRNNIHFGKWMEHGGWEKDVLTRVFRRSDLIEWKGDVHEEAKVHGTIGSLQEPLAHLTHRSIRDGLRKSYEWIEIEARLFIDAHEKPVTAFTLIRKPLFEFLRRYILQKGYKDGMEGLIESGQQAMNRFLVYTRVWELQQKPPIDERYAVFEREIVKMWEGKTTV